MKSFFKFLATPTLSVCVTCLLWLSAYMTKWQGKTLNQHETQYNQNFPISAFVVNNSGFMDFLAALPLICLLTSFVFLFKKQAIWALIMAAFPAVLILPLYAGTTWEFQQFLDFLEDPNMKELMKGKLEDF